MFDQFFGDYLIKNSIITKLQFEEVIEFSKSARVKLGLIAVSEKLLTVTQADEINQLQAVLDKRFGDIAVEKGYLTEANVKHLLSLQGNPYLIFVQALTDKGYLKLDEIEKHLSTYQKENNFSNDDLNAIKSGDIDEIVPIFITTKEPYYKEFIGLAIRTIIRFVDNHIRMEKGFFTSEYSFESLASQTMTGDHSIFVGFSSKANGLLTIANPFAKEEFEEINEDSFDSVCEFINCFDGLFASKLSNDNVELELCPPLSYSNKTVKCNGELYVVPIYIAGSQVDFIVSFDQHIDIA